MPGSSPDVLGQTKKRFKSIFRKRSKDPSTTSSHEDLSNSSVTTKDENLRTSTMTSPSHPVPAATTEPTKTSAELAATEHAKEASAPAEPAPIEKPAATENGKTKSATPATASSTKPHTIEKPHAVNKIPTSRNLTPTSAMDPLQGSLKTPESTGTPGTDIARVAMDHPVTRENTASTEDIVGGKPAHEHKQNTPGSSSNPTMSATSGPLEDHPIL